jgi:copper chaperone CopZ
MKASKVLIPILLIAAIFEVASGGLASKTTFEKKTAEISLPSVQCGMCQRTIEKALEKIEGILTADVDIENKKAVITYDDSKTNLSEIERTITMAGYDANDKTAEPNAYEKLHDCCKAKK